MFEIICFVRMYYQIRLVVSYQIVTAISDWTLMLLSSGHVADS